MSEDREREPSTDAGADEPSETDDVPRTDDPSSTAPPTRQRESASAVEGWARWLAALAAVALAALMLPGPDDFPLDDAWIHLAYAKSLRLGDGPSYNPGDWELGFSSPLWMGLLASWPTSGAPVRAVQLLGLLLHAITAWLAAHLGLSLARRRATLERPIPVLSMTLLCGVLAAASPTLVQASVSGMEVSLTAALTLAVSWACVVGHPVLAVLTGALSVWARPEMLGFVLALAAVLVGWRWRSGERGPTVRAPLAAGACFGSQELIKDVISGFFLIFDQVLESGDWVDVDTVSGNVEEVGLRVTKIRAFDGKLWYVPNGQIKLVGNTNREWMRAVVTVDLAYEQDVGRGMATLLDVGKSWAAENPESVLAEPEVHGLMGLGSSGVGARLSIKVTPGIQWAVERELRVRLKAAFDGSGIEIPFARQVVYLRQDDAAAS